jgi:uncharacterized membrane protein YqiK
MDLTTIKDRIVSEISSIVSEGAKILRIDTPEQYENVKKFGNEAFKKAKALEDERKALTKPLLDEKAEIDATFKEFIGNLDAVVSNIKTVIGTYDREQEQKRIELQRAADEAARKERERIEAEARAQREKEEAERRKAEEARAAAETARIAAEQAEGEEKARLEAEAAKAEKEAAKADSKAESWAEKADAKEAVSEMIVPVVVAMEATKGTTTVRKWIGEVTDKKALVEWLLAASFIDGLSLIEIDNGGLNKMIQASQGKLNIPGVQVVENHGTRLRK